MIEPTPGIIVFGTVVYDPLAADSLNARWTGPWKTTLTPIDTLWITFAGFPAGATLTEVTLTSKTDPARQVIWTPTGGPVLLQPPFVILAIQETPDLNDMRVAIVDTDFCPPTELDEFQMKLSGETGVPDASSTSHWHIDPEVVNKAAGGEDGEDDKAGA